MVYSIYVMILVWRYKSLQILLEIGQSFKNLA
jgi:hypothetical protein